MKGMGKMEINNVLIWHFFYLQMFYVPRVLHPDKNWRKLKNFKQEGIWTPLFTLLCTRLVSAESGVHVLCFQQLFEE